MSKQRGSCCRQACRTPPSAWFISFHAELVPIFERLSILIVLLHIMADPFIELVVWQREKLASSESGFLPSADCIQSHCSD